MRNFLKPSLEQYTEERVISLEEEVVMLDEATTDAGEVTSDLNEAERIIEVSDALEDLAVIADGIDEATPAEVALIENAGNLAVAGTDVQPEEIIPAMSGEVIDGVATESFVGKKIATEGIREVARTIWENIKKFLKGIWEKIENFFYKIFATIPNLRRKIEALQKRIDETVDAGKKPGAEKLKFTSGMAALSINYVPIKSEADLTAGLSDLADTCKFVFGTYIDNTAKRGEAIAKAIAEFDPSKAGECISSLRATLKSSKSSDLPKKGSADSSRFPGFATTMGAPLLGNVSLADKYYAEKGDDSDLAALDRYRSSRIELIATSDKGKVTAKEIEMAPMSTGGMSKMLEEATKLVNVLEEYKRGAKSKAIAASKKAIESASDKAEKAMAGAKDGDAGAKAAVPYYRAMLNFNAAFARWAQTPAMPVLQHSLITIRATCMVIEKSLSAYKA